MTHLFPRLLLGPETPQHGARHRRRAWFLDTPHGHAHVTEVLSASASDWGQNHLLRLHDDRNASRSDRLFHRERDLLGKSFLDLQPPCERLCDPGEFRQP
jgi:hypothetical protein